MTTTPEAKLPFDRIGDYAVLAPISEGGMASVWLGRSTTSGQLVALKVIRAEHGRNKEFVAMLVDEAGIASRLSHPNILSIRSLGHDGKRHFLVMDLLRGHSLLEVWKAAHAQGKRLPVAVMAWMGARIADALHYAHELRDEDGTPLGVVHRDVNPANIFVTREGIPKLIDFGLAKARDRIASTAIGVVKGKLAYLAPEQARGQAADRRSDVFALGVTLWELTLDRRLFFEGDDVETVRRVREADVPDPRTIDPSYPSALADAVVRALAREPDQRWTVAAELRDALDAYVASTGSAIDASSVRAALHAIFAEESLPQWERLADEVTAEQERTRIWNERKSVQAAQEPRPPEPVAPPAPAAVHVPPAAAAPAAAAAPPRRAAPASAALSGLGITVRDLLLIAAPCAFMGLFAVPVLVRSRGRRVELEQRVTRIEDVLGLGDAGTAPATVASAAPEGGAVVSADDRTGPCAVARIAGYEAWSEALARAKTNAGPSEAACAQIWNDKKKQACFYVAMSEIRATQVARDAIIAGGQPAHDAVRGVKDDPRNDAIARARAASEAAFAACGEANPP